MFDYLKWKPRAERSAMQKPTGRLAKAADSRLRFETLEPRLVLNGTSLVISEFMADNDRTLRDVDGNYPEWLEIYNPTAAVVDLDGWYLTDTSNDLTQWKFPDVSIDPGEYRVVFASGKNYRNPAGELHTNFGLADSGGDLVLVDSDGFTPIHSYLNYPAQHKDVSYGLTQDIVTVMAEGANLTYLVPTGPADATDGAGAHWTDPDFDDSTWIDSLLANPVKITEVGTGTVDFVEIQNVGGYVADTDGWVVALNWAALVGSPRAPDINAAGGPNNIEWALNETMAVDEVLFRSDDKSNDTTDPKWGEDIWWPKTGSGWVMIVDDLGNVVDFVVWNYSQDEIATMSVVVNGFTISLGDAWSGEACPEHPAVASTLTRIGNADDNDKADFDWVPDPFPGELDGTKGLPNGDLLTPFPGEGGPAPRAGVGFTGDVNGLGQFVRTGIEAEVRNVNASVWLRFPLDVIDPANYSSLQLQMQYEDGFVAYINGQEVARRNAPASAQWNSTALSDRSESSAGVFESFNIPVSEGLLQAGENMLAIQGLNDHVADGDFLISPVIRAVSINSAENYMSEPSPGRLNVAPMSGAMPIFSQESGTYAGQFLLEITTGVELAEIRYTLDGNEPTDRSTLYTDPITITTSTQIRVRVYEPGFQPGALVTQSYVFLAANAQSFRSELPVVIIDTFGFGSFNSSSYTSAHMAIFEPIDGWTQLTDDPALQTRAALRYRGSSSQGHPKKNYAVEAWGEDNEDIDISPLGMPAESDWILYAPYRFDRALNRNAFIYEISRQMGRWAARCRFVEVFTHTRKGVPLSYSDYQGVYVFMEKIKQGEDRVDVERLTRLDDRPPEVSGGYIFKRDRADPGDSGFSVSGYPKLYNVYPKEKNVDPELVVTSQQQTYLRNYLNTFNSVLNGPQSYDPVNGYAKYIDVGAWIDHIWLNLIPKNPDSLRLSGYFYKDRDGGVAAGPIWDFDRTMGCDDDGRASSPTQWNPQTTDATDHFTYNNWWTKLFRDPNFGQAFVDRWFEVREDVLSLANVDAIIDGHVGEISLAAANRNFAKWSQKAPNSGGWMGEINHMRNWLHQRIEWIDDQFLPLPRFSKGPQIVEPGFQFNLSFATPPPANTRIYYTLDGTDPRRFGGDASPNAILYDGSPITLNETAVVTARAWDRKAWSIRGTWIGDRHPEGGWSAPMVADYVVGNPAMAGTVVVSEVNYNPYDPTDEELDRQPVAEVDWTASDFEFIELLNTSDQTIELDRMQLTDGVTFDFGDVGSTELAAGERIVLASNLEAFAARYGDQIVPTGVWTGSLDNGGELLAIEDRFGAPILQFAYDDSGAWPGRADDTGATLELTDPSALPTTLPEINIFLADATNWRSSPELLGSPGTASAGPLEGVVVNEVLSQSDGAALDWIELYNTTGAAINVGGWFLSDSSNNFRKYRIAPDTVIAAGGYLVFDESDFNPAQPAAGQQPFALNSQSGDHVWLLEGDASGKATRFVDHVEFGAAAASESFGRVAADSGVVHFYPMVAQSQGEANASPRVGPLVISELMFDPVGQTGHDDFEYVEIYNPTDQTVALADWRIRGGVDFDFDSATELLPGEALLVVSFDPRDRTVPTMFRNYYGLGGAVEIAGPFEGVLDNGGERVRLERPGIPLGNDIPRILEDEVRYYTTAPWPEIVGEAPGPGDSLTRRSDLLWGHASVSWIAAAPSPGTTDMYLHAGDANLDDVTDVRDFMVWNVHKFTSGTDWTTGDFDGNGVTDVRDFMIWNVNKFTSAPAPVPPELAAPALDALMAEPTDLTLDELISLDEISKSPTAGDSDTSSAEQAVDRLLASYWE